MAVPNRPSGVRTHISLSVVLNWFEELERVVSAGDNRPSVLHRTRR
jgi:hypothetical protein